MKTLVNKENRRKYIDFYFFIDAHIRKLYFLHNRKLTDGGFIHTLNNLFITGLVAEEDRAQLEKCSGTCKHIFNNLEVNQEDISFIDNQEQQIRTLLVNLCATEQVLYESQ